MYEIAIQITKYIMERIKFFMIFVLLSTMTAWAATKTETRTATWYMAVSPSGPLRIMFSSSSSETSGYFGFRDGTIVVTYDVEVEITDDPGHTFTFGANASSDAIIATCTEESASVAPSAMHVGGQSLRCHPA